MSNIQENTPVLSDISINQQDMVNTNKSTLDIIQGLDDDTDIESKYDEKSTIEATTETKAVEGVAATVESLEDDANATTIITLISKDLGRFEIDKKSAFVSTLIKESLEKDDTPELEIPSVNSVVLEKVVEYMKHHKGKEEEKPEKPIKSKIMSEVCTDQWDATFIDAVGLLGNQILYDVILAANYLDMQTLLHIGCAKVASLIKGQPLEKLKEILSTGEKSTSDVSDASAAPTTTPPSDTSAAPTTSMDTSV